MLAPFHKRLGQALTARAPAATRFRHLTGRNGLGFLRDEPVAASTAYKDFDALGLPTAALSPSSNVTGNSFIVASMEPHLLTAFAPSVTSWYQGGASSCVIHAYIVAEMAYLHARGVAFPTMPNRLIAYRGARWFGGNTKLTDAGSHPYDLLNYLNDKGICPEAQWPYKPSLINAPPPKHALIDGLDRKGRAGHAIRDRGDSLLVAITSCLKADIMPQIAIEWGSTLAKGRGSYFSYEPSPDSLHMIPIYEVEYYNGQYWLGFQNSHGANWGGVGKGRGYLSQEFLDHVSSSIVATPMKEAT